MNKITTALMIVFFGFANFGYAHDTADSNSIYQAMSKSEVHNATYNSCLNTASEDDSYFMGFIKTEDDFKEFCGCTANKVTSTYVEGITSQNELKSIVEQKGYQCIQPYIKPAVLDICIKAANANNTVNGTEKCQCFGDQIAWYSSKDINGFMIETNKYLDYSAQYCGLKD